MDGSDGWMVDAWMDGWMDAWMVEWTDGWIGWMNGSEEDEEEGGGRRRREEEEAEDRGIALSNQKRVPHHRRGDGKNRTTKSPCIALDWPTMVMGTSLG